MIFHYKHIMKEFPPCFTVNNSDKFKDYFYNRNLCYLRRNVYEHVIKGNINDPFDITDFNEKFVNNIDTTLDMIKNICEELNSRGWRCSLAYGNSSLYIYQEGKKPLWCGEEF